jgi:hypothetical protein
MLREEVASTKNFPSRNRYIIPDSVLFLDLLLHNKFMNDHVESGKDLRPNPALCQNLGDIHSL